MLDIGGIEILIIGIIALVVVGPKELPRLLRSISGIVRKIKNLSSEFRSGLDDLAREVDVKNIVPDFDEDPIGDPFEELREEEGITADMSPEEVTDHIMSNKADKADKTDKEKDAEEEDPEQAYRDKRVGSDDD